MIKSTKELEEIINEKTKIYEFLIKRKGNKIRNKKFEYILILMEKEIKFQGKKVHTFQN